MAMAVVVLLAGGYAIPAVAETAAGELTTDWTDGHASQVRMLAGRGSKAVAGQSGGIVAGVEIVLQPGWKTYWRSPGEDGGIPPEFDWSKSKNVADARVVFPAPKRLASVTGESIGYKDSVVLPVIVTPGDASEPVELALDLAFGVCSDICIRAEASLALDVPPGASPGLPEGINKALEHAPRAIAQKRPGDPELAGHEIVLMGKEPHILLDVDFGANPEKGDVFAEAPAGLYLPMAHRVTGAGKSPGTPRFKIDLTQSLDIAELKGKTIRLTLVGVEGQSEREIILK